MMISKKILLSISMVIIGIFIIPFLFACSNNTSTPPSIEQPVAPPPLSGEGITVVKSDSTNLGHAVSNPNINTTNKDNAFLIADSQYIPYNNEGNGPIHKLQTNYIANSQYLNMSKRSYSIIFKENFHSFSFKMGTTWILDYQLTNDNTYPTTWYFATNAHVANNLRVKNDYNNNSKYDYQDLNANTTQVFLVGAKDISQIGPPQLGGRVKNLFEFDTKGCNVAELIIKTGTPNIDDSYSNNPAVKTVFSGLDYLDSHPSDFNKDPIWKNVEEFIDFAILEIKFPNQLIAKEITNDYVNWNENEKFKLPTSSLLNDEVNLNNNQHYVLGFPAEGNSTSFSNLTINKIEAKPPIISEGGTKLANTKIFSTFENQKYKNKGIMDAAIGTSWFRYGFLNGGTNSVNNPTPSLTSYQSWGLCYILQNANLSPGASGSMVMNENFETIGIHFAIDQSADYGISAALISDGYDYNGKYGWYNLPAYDLINGGKSGQKDSYKQSMVNIYGSNSNIRTHIFKNGF